MYEEGVEKVEENLDMVKMMKMMVHNTAAARATVMNLQLHDVITHSENLVVAIDDNLSMSSYSDGVRNFERDREQVVELKKSLRAAEQSIESS